MGFRDGFFALVAIALSALALAGMVYTDEYSSAARAEARGVAALTHVVLSDASAPDLALTASAPEAVQQ
ncbi:hypothetical protein [Pseudoduganella sp. RAF53_2]|jgi:hypothetical protein|uniref:hypothetical protein n=1 Tax=unclassified Pseudoduganella TaxID=2637179 RepID=UPI003F95BD64